MTDARSFISDIKEKYGDKIDSREYDNSFDVIPTPSLSLNIATGIGGIPTRRFTQIYGPKSVGKSTLALSCCKQPLLDGDSCLYIDLEGTTDLGYAELVLGSKEILENLYIITPASAEDALQVAEDAIKSGSFKLVILDSIGALASKKMLEAELTDQHYALTARLLSIWIPRQTVNMREQNVAFIFLNQVRDKIGSMFKTYSTPGGHALEHCLSLEIKFTSGQNLEETIDGQKTVIGTNTKFSISKNKVHKPHRSGVIPFIYGRGIDTERDILEFASMLGVVKKAGAYFRLGSDTLGQGIVKAAEFLKENPEVAKKISDTCYEVLGLKEGEPEVQEALDKSEK